MHGSAILKSAVLSFVLLLAALAVPHTADAAQTGTVQGVVRGEDGKVLPGASVALVGTGAGQKTYTGKAGDYAFAGVLPGTYQVRVSSVTYEVGTTPVTVTADTTANVDFSLVKHIITGQRRVTVAGTRRNDPSTTVVVTARDEQKEKSQPNNLYQDTGLLLYKPGVTFDAGQYPHIRGSDGNQIEWMLDGIDLRDPLLNQSATNLVTVGVATSNIVTGGPTADYGNALGGFVNSLTVNGRDIAPGRTVGGYIENTNGPSSPWQYYGGTTQIGGVLPGNKFDYALSSVVFQNHFADNTQLYSIKSDDLSAKFNYYSGPSDTFTVYAAHGQENYDYTHGSQNTVFFDPDHVLTSPSGVKYLSATDLSSPFDDHNVQTYNLDHFTYKHNFTPASFIQYRIYQLHQGQPQHDESTQNGFIFFGTNITGNQLSYSNAFSRQNTLTAGMEYLDDRGSYERAITNVQNGPLADGDQYNDRIYGAYPTSFGLYAADSLRTKDNKYTLDLGARLNSTTYHLSPSKYAASIGQPNPDGYTTKSLDPRLGLTYSPDPDLTFRSSYAVTSQDPDMRRVQRVGPDDLGLIGTSLTGDPLSQSEAAYNVEGFSRLKLSHSKGVDLGVEKAFRVGGPAAGQYSASLTAFKKRLYDLTYLDSPNYDPNVGPTTPYIYDNEGTSHVSGFELTLHKLQRRPSDWSGYVSYTNQVARANTSDFDTTYIPYFSAYEAGNPYFTDSSTTPGTLPGQDLRVLNHREFAVSWDQRHTVSTVIGKHFSRLLDSTFILDAGSGLPFFASAAADGNFSAGAGPGFGELFQVFNPDPQRGGADFGEVPVTLNSSGLLPPVNPVVGYTGWHYKLSVNTNFNLTSSFSLFFNVDNIFDRRTALSLATTQLNGVPYYEPPSPEYPQGRQVYRASSQLTPIFLTFGFRQKF
jgi:outer membrane receptor protein involved in Fe transport